MAKRGRKSAGDFESVTNLPKRPEPLAHLSPDEQEVWRVVVNRMPIDWFPAETWDLLAAYCNHVVAHRNIVAMQPEDEGDLTVLDRHRRMVDRETSALARIGTKLRITTQSNTESHAEARKLRNQYKDISEDY